MLFMKHVEKGSPERDLGGGNGSSVMRAVNAVNQLMVPVLPRQGRGFSAIKLQSHRHLPKVHRNVISQGGAC